MAITKEQCPTNFVLDVPSEEDLLGGAHQRVAEAIADIVWTEIGGLSIGLEGDWGIGKSTIVRIVSSILGESGNRQKFAVPVFDAWAHEGDPLRRTFLESIIRHLMETHSWLDSETWDQRLKILAGRVHDSTTKTTPQLGQLGLVLVGFLLMAPLALAFLNEGLRQGVSFALQSSLPLNWNFAIGLGAYGILVIAIIYAASREGLNSLAVVIQKVETETKTVTIESPDPTSVEFERVFTDLVLEALHDETHKMVVVLDNLDRVPSEDARAILSTLQTFLQHAQHGQISSLNAETEDAFDRLWVLIPYSNEGIRRIWEENDQDGSTSHMLQKRFVTRFTVPPMVLSNWRAYLIDRLQEAFPRHSDRSELGTIYNVYHLTLRKYAGEEFVPTPRDLKVFVNQLGALHRQWGDQFPLPVMAHYAAVRRYGDEKDIPLLLFSNEFPDPKISALVGPDIRDYFAALWFNVEVPLARERLLRPILLKALREGKPEDLSGLMGSNHKVLPVVESLSFDFASDLRFADELANSAHAMIMSKLLEDKSRPAAITVLRNLRRAFDHAALLSDLDLELAEKLASAVLITEDTSLILRIVEIVDSGPNYEEVPETELPLRRADWASDWSQGITHILTAKSIRDMPGFELPSSISVPGDSSDFIQVCGEMPAAEGSRAIWGLLKSARPQEELFETLTSTVRQGYLGVVYKDPLPVMREAFPELPLADVGNALAARLQGTHAYIPGELNSMLGALWNLRSGLDNFEALLNSIRHPGHLVHHLEGAIQNEDWDAAAWCLFSHVFRNPNYEQVPEIGSSVQGKASLIQILAHPEAYSDITRIFLEITGRFGDPEFLFEMTRQAGLASRFGATMLLELSGGGSAGEFTADRVVEDWASLDSQLDDDKFAEFIGNLIGETDLIESVNAQDFDLSDAGLYLAMVENEAAKNSTFRALIRNGLKAIERVTWESELRNEGSALKLLVAMRARDYKLDLETDFKEALGGYSEAVADGAAIPQVLDSHHWELIPSALQAFLRNNYRRHVLDHLEELSGAIADTFFDYFGREIADAKLLLEDKRIVPDLFAPLVTSRHTRGLQWLAEFLEGNQAFLGDYRPSDYVKELALQVTKAIDSDVDDGAAQYIHRIEKLL